MERSSAKSFLPDNRENSPVAQEVNEYEFLRELAVEVPKNASAIGLCVPTLAPEPTTRKASLASRRSRAQAPKRRVVVPARKQCATDGRSLVRQAAWAGVVLLGLVLLLRGLSAAWRGAAEPDASPATTLVENKGASSVVDQQPLVTKPIEEVRVGDRVAGRNPLREQADLFEPDPQTWRKIGLRMTKESGQDLWIELLRPRTWVDEENATPGGTVFVELFEMGAVGDAEVLFVEPCPAIARGEGTVVTGTFKHLTDDNTNLVRLRLEDQRELTCVTDTHAYWSEDRGDFIEAGKLQVGETVDTEYGPRQVVAITPIEHHGFLYNLETTEHVYRVGSLGTLVHNDCVERALAAARRHGGEALERPNHFRFPNRQAARQAASEIAGNMGRNVNAIPLKSFRGVPSRIKDSTRVIGRRSADGRVWWRDDFLGHPRFGAGPHVNVFVDGIDFHLWY